ncbi:SgcJ/EcaC family oxidoreductase [Nocardia abscessus]|uniref:SgcJ/EcaC family oxidoreductase n=1 Tax=Nocardia abscessus TaxID=120957 RepID=UPI00189622AD|nr:SgcJ/EcaC family oxidoreductase [Nocardia abscessus]MBF6334302.1 SgcJ/EcaC family oxidoreductase [Nocardia abscessus]
MNETIRRTATDEARIRALFEDLMQAWTDNDAEAYAGLFTDDSDYVSYDGTRATGRAEHQHNHDKLFRGVLAGSALVGELESIRFVTPDVAILHGTASVLMPWRSRLPERRRSRQTLVLVRASEGWRVTAIHNGRVRPVTVPEPDSFPSAMSRLMSRVARTMGLGRRSAR